MDDPVDDKLKQRIKGVFDNYDDAFAGEGWLLLREKFPEKQRRRPLLWLWSAAAILLFFLGFIIHMYVTGNKQADDKKISYKLKSVQPAQPQLPQQKIVTTDQKTTLTANGTPDYKIITGSKARAKQIKVIPSTTIVALKQNQVTTKQAGQIQSPVTNSSRTVSVQQMNQVTAIGGDSIKQVAALNELSSLTDVQPKLVSPDTTARALLVIKPKTIKSIEELFAADQGKTIPDKKVNADKKVRLGVYGASYFNYAKGSNNQINAGAGFTADIALTGKLKLVTGLSINQNSFTYNGSGGFDPSYAAPVAYGLGTSVNNTYTQNASLVGIDLPIDLKYVLNYQRNQVYVLAGVGSGTFINESYSYNYSNGSTAASMSSNKGFNDFYFARTLNMAIGVGYPLGRDQIVIEPFVKYPLQGLGAEQLHFGASGINLKFNFSIKK